MEEQKMSIIQRNKINQILRSGKSLPTAMNKKKSTPNGFPAIDKMRAKNARRRTLDSILASGDYERTKYTPSNSSLVFKVLTKCIILGSLRNHLSQMI